MPRHAYRTHVAHLSYQVQRHTRRGTHPLPPLASKKPRPVLWSAWNPSITGQLAVNNQNVNPSHHWGVGDSRGGGSPLSHLVCVSPASQNIVYMNGDVRARTGAP